MIATCVESWVLRNATVTNPCGVYGMGRFYARVASIQRTSWASLSGVCALAHHHALGEHGLDPE